MWQPRDHRFEAVRKQGTLISYCLMRQKKGEMWTLKAVTCVKVEKPTGLRHCRALPAKVPISVFFLERVFLSFLTPAWSQMEMHFDRTGKSCSVATVTSIPILQVYQRPLRPLTK